MASGTIKCLNQVTKESLTWNQQSGNIVLIRSGKLRILVFDDAKTPTNASYFTAPTDNPFAYGVDAPIFVTTGLLRCGANIMSFWVRTAGSIGQSGGAANSLVNGEVVWLVP